MIQFILKPKKEKLVLLLCLFVCMCGEHLVVLLQVSYYNSVFNSSCLIRGSCWEKIYKSTQDGVKQTNKLQEREREIHLKHHKFGEGGLKCASFLHQQWRWVSFWDCTCVVLRCVYLYNWVMLWNTWLPPTTAGVKTEHFCL